MAYTDRQLRNIAIFARVAGGVVMLIVVFHIHPRAPWCGCAGAGRHGSVMRCG